jgi:hypothetical protein
MGFVKHHILTCEAYSLTGQSLTIKSVPFAPDVISSKRITERTKGNWERPYFLRAHDVDFGYRFRPDDLPNVISNAGVLVATGAVRIERGGAHVIFAGGSVELDGDACEEAIIVSGGDVHIKCAMAASLVIARGKFLCTGLRVEGNRIISGTSATAKSRSQNNIITENEAHPLGFIRWSDPAKDKTAPKGK